jgi:hypothetical protein
VRAPAVPLIARTPELGAVPCGTVMVTIRGVSAVSSPDEKLALAPAGSPLSSVETWPLNPLKSTGPVEREVCPGARSKAVGLEGIAKSGTTVSEVFTVNCAVWVTVGEVAVTVTIVEPAMKPLCASSVP